ncbi:hypothetical protein ABPG77_003428 [Micractinium sp. CCAP 211/92]
MPADPAAEEAPKPQQCSLCGDFVLESQAGIQASCSVCASSFLASRVRQLATNRKAINKRARAAQKHPWRQLVTQRCPRGWQQGSDKGPQGSKAGQAGGGSWESRHACSGRIQAAELIEAPQEKKKKKKRAAPPQLATRQQQQQQRAGLRGGAGGRAAAGGSRAAAGPAVKMSLAAAQAFLGIEAEEEGSGEEGSKGEGSEGEGSAEDRWEEEEGESEGAYGEEAGSDKGEGPGAQQQEEGQQQAGATEGAALGAGDGAAAVTAGCAAGAGAATCAEPAEPAEPLTREEAEVAVREGLLPPSYRTQLCSRYLSGLSCRQPAACPHAHSLEELRVDAAIEDGLLPENLKTAMCSMVVQTGSCPFGRACLAAHSVEEIRVRASIEAGITLPTYKTQLCPYFSAHRVCPNGLLCHHAHGLHELRREAAVQLGRLHPCYKTTLCDVMLATGRCPAGDACQYAHAVGDLRRHAAIRDKLLSPAFKTTLCSDFERFGACQNGNRCSYAHGPSDRLPHIVTSATLCPILQETGHCEPTCPFAHDVSDLELPLEELRIKVQRALGVSSGPHGRTERGAASRDGGTHLSAAALGAAAAAAEAGGTSAGSGIHAGDGSVRQRDWGFTAAATSSAAEGSVCSGHRVQGEGGSKEHPPGGPGSSGAPSLAAAPQRSRRGPKQKPPSPHEMQLARLLAGGQRPSELRQCKTFDDCGKCWSVDCPFAHGIKDLKDREKRWVEGETERRRQRHQQWQELRRQKRERDRAEQRRQVEALARLKEEAQLRQVLAASAQLAASSQAASASRLAAAAIWLSDAALAMLRGHKLMLCSLQLLEAGFEEAQARAAAEAAGADVERAFELVLGTPSPGAAPPADVSREVVQLLEHARGLGLGPTDVERAIMLAAGDWQEAQEHLGTLATAAGSANSSISSCPGQGPNPLPLPKPVAAALHNGSDSLSAGATAEEGSWGAGDRGAPPASAAAAWPAAEPLPTQPVALAEYSWLEPAAAAAASAPQTPAASSVQPGAVAVEPAPAGAGQQAEAQSVESAGFESFVDAISSAWQEGQHEEADGEPPMPGVAPATPGVAPATPAAGVEPAAAEPSPLQQLQQVAASGQPGQEDETADEFGAVVPAVAVAADADRPTASEGEVERALPAGQRPPAAADQQEVGAGAEAQPSACTAGEHLAAAAAKPADHPAGGVQAEAGPQPELTAAGTSTSTVAAEMAAAGEVDNPSCSAAAWSAGEAPVASAAVTGRAAPAEAHVSAEGAVPAAPTAVGEPAPGAEEEGAAAQMAEQVDAGGTGAPVADSASRPSSAGGDAAQCGVRAEEAGSAAAAAVDAPLRVEQAAATAAEDEAAFEEPAVGAAVEAAVAGECPVGDETAVAATRPDDVAPQLEMTANAHYELCCEPAAMHATPQAETAQPEPPKANLDTVDELLALLGIS